MTGSSSGGECSSRKRSLASTGSKNTNGSASGKRPRGRPRIETNDQTSKDKRRTQVRQAQRDYRKREKNRLSTLEQRSNQLHSTVEQMHETFLHFQESAQKLGLLQSNPEFSKQFKHVFERFTELKKEANDAILEGSENEDDTPKQDTPLEQTVDVYKRSQGQILQTATPPEAEHADLGWGYAATTEAIRNSSSPSQPPITGNYLSNISSSSYHLNSNDHSPHTINEASTTHQCQTPTEAVLDRAQPTHTTHHQHQLLPFGLIAPAQEHSPQYSFTFSANIPTPGISPPMTRLSTPPKYTLPDIMATRGLPSIRTYSYEETSFARRLTRATLESAYQLLSQPQNRLRSLDSVFRLSMPFTTLDNLLKKFKWVVSRDVDEDLDWWDTPFIHLGGAGTHYPRRDPQGNILPLKNSWTVRQTGPFERHMMRLESVADGRWEDIRGVDLRGFEGEWFDAHDVQGYLEEHWACKIDMRSSFAQCLVAEEDLATLQTTGHEPGSPNLSRGSIPINHSAQGSNTFNAFGPYYGLDTSSFQHSSAPSIPQANDLSRTEILDLQFDQAIGLDLAPGSSLGFAGNAGFNVEPTLGLGAPSEVGGMAVVSQKRSKAAWVDVTKLIEGLFKHACCLGRAPGYRRAKVDQALREALVQPY